VYCACALVVLTYLNTCLDFARFPSYHGQLFAGPHAQAPGDKSEETLVFPPASFVDVGVKEEKLWVCVPACQHVGTHSCSRAIYNSVCVWYIVERAQTRNCCAGCFRRLGAFVVGPASTSSEVIRAVLNGRSMSAASLALHVSKTPMLYVPCLVRACLPAICIAYAPGLVSMHIMLSLCRCRGRCVAVAVAVAVADVHCTAASTLPLCMAVMFCTLSCM